MKNHRIGSVGMLFVVLSLVGTSVAFGSANDEAKVSGNKTVSAKPAVSAPAPTPAKAYPVKSAQTTSNNPYKNDTELDEDNAPRPVHESPWYIFGGIDLGFSAYSSNSAGSDASRSGFQGGVRGLFSHYWTDFVVDAGLGWQLITNKGTEINGSTDKVVSRLGHFDFAGRYRLDRHWQIGPELEFYLSSDQGLNSDITSRISNNGLLGGLQGLYEWNDPKKLRLGARWLTAMNGDARTVNVFQVFFEFGFPIFDSHSDDEEVAPTPQRRRAIEQVNARDLEKADDYVPSGDPLPVATPGPIAQEPATEVDDAIEVQANQHKVILTLDVNALPFAFDNAKLPAANAEKVREIGRFLAEHQENWKKMVVAGHTDERGKAKYNEKLSLSRAKTVRQLLVDGGAPGKRITIVGYGKRHPKDKGHNEKAWAKNRRVELEFQGVKDVMILKSGLKSKH